MSVNSTLLNLEVEAGAKVHTSDEATISEFSWYHSHKLPHTSELTKSHFLTLKGIILQW